MSIEGPKNKNKGSRDGDRAFMDHFSGTFKGSRDGQDRAFMDHFSGPFLDLQTAFSLVQSNSNKCSDESTRETRAAP